MLSGGRVAKAIWRQFDENLLFEEFMAVAEVFFFTKYTEHHILLKIHPMLYHFTGQSTL
jgi:hypothetical protein